MWEYFQKYVFLIKWTKKALQEWWRWGWCEHTHQLQHYLPWKVGCDLFFPDAARRLTSGWKYYTSGRQHLSVGSRPSSLLPVWKAMCVKVACHRRAVPVRARAVFAQNTNNNYKQQWVEILCAKGIDNLGNIFKFTHVAFLFLFLGETKFTGMKQGCEVGQVVARRNMTKFISKCVSCSLRTWWIITNWMRYEQTTDSWHMLRPWLVIQGLLLIPKRTTHTVTVCVPYVIVHVGRMTKHVHGSEVWFVTAQLIFILF